MNKNILLDRLPQYTENGLRIRTDFRESIKFELLMQDSKIKKEDKIAYALNLYYYEPNKIKNIQEAIQEIVWFYGGGKKDKEIKINDKEQVQEKTKQIYSYEFDDEYIYSAFMEQYGIDLNKIKYLHWWKFRALMSCLNENTQFVKIMGYRNTELSSIKDKSMKSFYKKMKKQYALPDMRSEEEKELDFANELW